MNPSLLIAVLLAVISILLGLLCCQQLHVWKVTRSGLKDITAELAAILDENRDGRVLVFSDNPALTALAAQLNRLLAERWEQRADYRRTQSSAQNMLSNISHDLKTPMTVLLGYLEIMRLKDEYPADLLGKAEGNARRVMSLIEEFFTLSKLEAGDLTLERTQVDLAELCRETVLSFYELLTGQGFQVELSLPDTPIYGWTDRTAVRRILNNLLSNAIRYGRDGAYLGVSLRPEGDRLFLTVTDHGRGIERAFQARIFDRLFTLEDSRSRALPGNGLGLAISRTLARRLGGDLSVASTPHVRTAFTLQVPAFPHAPPSGERNL